ncbi:TonB-dependent receptor [Flammeovirgaceae bacterium SG7u.111]|nr:TonB-dependent receptor [Flammeovirgaceae bacterium SG7u.132]WPO34814.1 TonB-dependent receptor [Flammeovirgaceae bacterium SG7u.111]
MAMRNLVNRKWKNPSRSLFLRCAMAFGMLLMGMPLLAQSSYTIKGRVVSASDKEGLPGAMVLIKGSETGVITNYDGNFELKVNPNDVLVVSFLGYITQEIEITTQTEINVALEDNISELEEVVVIGYGVQQKKLVTGATGQVKGDEFVKLSATDAMQGLQGQVAGVNIASTSGQPGEGMKVTIRGAGTINGSGPLYVVDGMQTGDISYLNNSDIESIDVLKDAAAAAIYGSQAANGVVLITTKTGKAGKSNFSFDAFYGLQEPSRQISMLNSTEYAVIMNEAAVNSGKVPYFSQEEINAMGGGTNWIDEMIYNDAVTQNYSLGLNGGTEKSIYSLSMSYTGQEGIVGGPGISEYNRYAFRVNTEHSAFDDIVKVGQHLTFSYVDKNGISVGNQYNNTFRSAFNTSPFLPMYDDAGNFLNNSANAGVMYQGQEWEPWAPGESNPYATMVYENQNQNNDQKVFGDVYVELSPIKNLKIRSRLGVDFYTSESRGYKPIYELSIYSQRTFDQASQSLNKGLALTFDNTATYEFELGNHNLSVMAGMFSYKNNGSSMYTQNADLKIPGLTYAYINNTTNTDFTKLSFNGSPYDESKLLSYLGRVSYDYKGKYLLNATFRADGSSRFAENNRWGYFPSVSAGWVLSDEAFLSDQDGWLDFLKLRASWGQVGNQNVNAFQYLAPINVGGSNYYFGSADFDASGNVVGAYPSRLANESLRWETSEQTNVGIDAHFFSGELILAADWYNKTTKDWILQKPGYATDGTDAPFFNGGNVRNMGVELAATWRKSIGDFNFSINGTVAKNENEVLEVPTEDGIVPGLENMLYDNSGVFYRRAETGFPIGYFWGWKTDGVFQNEGEVDAHTSSDGGLIQPNALPGDLKYVDLNNDGLLNDDDKTMLGDPNPDYTFSLSFSADYKGFDFSILAYGVAGNQIVQSYRNHANGFANYSKSILGRWHGEGTSNTIPRVTEANVNYKFSDVFVHDGDFVRLNNVTIGYDFSRLFESNVVNKVRFYASVLNALTFTNYDGMDPEVGYGLENGSAGVDLGFYPRPRTYLLGLNVNF